MKWADLKTCNNKMDKKIVGINERKVGLNSYRRIDK